MTQQSKRDSLQYLTFLTKKQCGRIKGRGCADGRKQCKHTHHDDASSPPIMTSALLLNCVIDAKEQREVTTLDVSNALV
eukprot:4744641-Ditylum_brightwellii.AAC.1